MVPLMEFSVVSLMSVPGSIRPATWNAANWRSVAACSHMDTELFFPVGESSQVHEQIRLAKSVCAACPVQEFCLEFAIRTIQNDGIWGGATEEERKIIKRSRRAAARRAVQAQLRAEASEAAQQSTEHVSMLDRTG